MLTIVILFAFFIRARSLLQPTSSIIHTHFLPSFFLCWVQCKWWRGLPHTKKAFKSFHSGFLELPLTTKKNIYKRIISTIITTTLIYCSNSQHFVHLQQNNYRIHHVWDNEKVFCSELSFRTMACVKRDWMA